MSQLVDWVCVDCLEDRGRMLPGREHFTQLSYLRTSPHTLPCLMIMALVSSLDKWLPLSYTPLLDLFTISPYILYYLINPFLRVKPFFFFFVYEGLFGCLLKMNLDSNIKYIGDTSVSHMTLFTSWGRLEVLIDTNNLGGAESQVCHRVLVVPASGDDDIWLPESGDCSHLSVKLQIRLIIFSYICLSSRKVLLRTHFSLSQTNCSYRN